MEAGPVGEGGVVEVVGVAGEEDWAWVVGEELEELGVLVEGEDVAVVGGGRVQEVGRG